MNRKHLGSSGKSKERSKSKTRDRRRNLEKPKQMSTDVFEMELL